MDDNLKDNEFLNILYNRAKEDGMKYASVLGRNIIFNRLVKINIPIGLIMFALNLDHHLVSDYLKNEDISFQMLPDLAFKKAYENINTIIDNVIGKHQDNLSKKDRDILVDIYVKVFQNNFTPIIENVFKNFIREAQCLKLTEEEIEEIVFEYDKIHDRKLMKSLYLESFIKAHLFRIKQFNTYSANIEVSNNFLSLFLKKNRL